MTGRRSFKHFSKRKKYVLSNCTNCINCRLLPNRNIPPQCIIKFHFDQIIASETAFYHSWHFQSDSVSRWIFRKSLTSPWDDPPRCVCTPMYGIGVRTERALLLVVYVRYWNRIQRDPWPIANIREFTKSTTAAKNRSIFHVRPTVATSKRTSSHLHQHSPLSFTTNCVSAARPTRRRRAQSDLVSISRFFENGTQQLPNILEQNVIYSAQSSMVRLNKDALRNTQLLFLSSQQASHAWPLISL